MTTKEQLHRLVDELGEEQAGHALVLLKTVTESRPTSKNRRRVPASLGIGDSGRGDLSEHVGEALAEGFGR